MTQIIQLGRHRIAHGDSRDPAVIAALLDGRVVDQLLFDPEWDDLRPDDGQGFSRVLAFCDGWCIGRVIELFGAPAWAFTWNTGGALFSSRRRPLRQAKYGLWFTPDRNEYNQSGAHWGEPAPRTERRPSSRGRHLTDCYTESLTALSRTRTHRHEKPLTWVRLLLHNCFPHEWVLDPFLGSGASIIATESGNTRKTILGVEQDANAIERIIERYHLARAGTPASEALDLSAPA